jgi:hypothetical protein
VGRDTEYRIQEAMRAIVQLPAGMRQVLFPADETRKAYGRSIEIGRSSRYDVVESADGTLVMTMLERKPPLPH